MGIGSAEEWMPQTSKKEWCICFNYYEEGKLVNTKYRDLAKNFKMVAGAEVIPYNIDGIKGTPECIITEGEIDALSFAEIGRTDVISVPTGANVNLSWLDRFMETHFADKQVIYIAVDTDRKGQELRKELIRRLGAGRCRVVEYPTLPPPPPFGVLLLGQEESSCGIENSPPARGGVPVGGGGGGRIKVTECKDANEVLVRHGAGTLKQCLAEAKEIPLPTKTDGKSNGSTIQRRPHDGRLIQQSRTLPGRKLQLYTAKRRFQGGEHTTNSRRVGTAERDKDTEHRPV